MNEIRLIQNNTHTFTSKVEGIDTSGYTATFTAKSPNNDDILFELTGVKNGDSYLFEITPTQSQDLNGKYDYEINITDGQHNYTLVQSKLIINDSLKW